MARQLVSPTDRQPAERRIVVGSQRWEPVWVVNPNALNLPATTRRLAVKVTEDVARQIRSGHPWVFDESITSVQPEGQAGDLAVIFGARREFMAIGLYDPASPIRIKVLHHGRPVPIDEDFWTTQLIAALDRRSSLSTSGGTTGYRCVHGENDGLPGFVLDRYDDTLVLKLYTAAWFPHLATMVGIIGDLLEPTSLVLRLSRNVQRGETFGLSDGMALIGEAPSVPVMFEENGLTFEADVVHGQKTGFFLDQRDNRARVRARARGRRVLDVFSASGGFSVNAAAGGAALVHSVDISPAAISATRRNLAHNEGLATALACKHETSTGDAMAVMQTLIDRAQTFDIVIVDPPSFASRQSQVAGAVHAYGRLTQLALRLLEPGGTLVQASCSSRVTSEQFFDAVKSTATRTGADLADVSTTGHAIDHPVGFAEGAYLKAIFATAWTSG